MAGWAAIFENDVRQVFRRSTDFPDCVADYLAQASARRLRDRPQHEGKHTFLNTIGLWQSAIGYLEAGRKARAAQEFILFGERVFFLATFFPEHLAARQQRGAMSTSYVLGLGQLGFARAGASLSPASRAITYVGEHFGTVAAQAHKAVAVAYCGRIARTAQSISHEITEISPRSFMGKPEPVYRSFDSVEFTKPEPFELDDISDWQPPDA
jgi:hypothetical protein